MVKQKRTTLTPGSPFKTMLSRFGHALKLFPQDFEGEQSVFYISINRDVRLIQDPVEQ